VVLTGLWEANYRVYGARKLCRAARRAGHQVGRDQVGRLMKAAGLRGVRRGRQVFTTRPDRSAERHPDLVKRDFTGTGPNQLWVTDLTYIPTWAGVAYVCFIIDVFSRMIVGWRVASICAPTWCWTRSRWPVGTAAPTSPVRGVIPTRGHNSPVFGTVNASPKSALFLQLAPSAIPTITRSPRRSTACSRPN